MAVELEYSRRLKQNINVPWDYADYSPLDLPFSVRGFLRLLRPQRLTIIQRELWPNLIRISTEKKIPQILLGVNFPKTRLWPVYHPCLCQFDRIGTIDGASKERLTIHNPSLRVEVTGNPRVDRVVSRKQMSQPSLNRQFKEGVFLAASLWPADFRILKDAISQILRAEPTLQLILVPHELDERFIKTICHWFERQRLSYRRWSEASNAWLSHLVVDEIGILAELYSISTIVFVGGSFHARVHSVLEPAVYGRPILTGPFIENSIEASELSSTQGLKVCKNAEEVASSAIGFLSSKDSLQQAEGALRTYIERGLHSGRRSAEFLKNASLVLEPA